MAEFCTFHSGEERDAILEGGWGSLNRRNGIHRLGWKYMGDDGVLQRGWGSSEYVWGNLQRLGVIPRVVWGD